MRVKLGEYIEQIRGVSYKPEDICKELNENTVILLRANNIQDGKLNLNDIIYVKKENVKQIQYLMIGDILICTSSGSKNLVGKAVFINKNLTVTFGAFCKVVRPKISCPQYLGHFFNSPYYRNIISNLSAGANINNIRNKDIDELKIFFPSQEEQEKIAAVLDNVSNLITLRKKQLEKLEELVKARFIEMFGDLVINPNNYPILLLSEIAEYWNGLTYKPEHVAEKGTIVLRSSNSQNNQLDFKDIIKVNCKISERQYVQNNDILMCSRNGSAKLVGKVALIKNLFEPMSFGAFMMIIRSQYFSYLLLYFQMDAFKTQIATSATTTINQITKNMLNEIRLPVPNMTIINQFTTFFTKVDKQKLTIQQSLDKLEILKKALMQEYFG